MVATEPRVERETPAPLRLPTRRRWRSLILIITLMITGATAGVVALAQMDQRTSVLVAASDLPAGHQLTAADVRVVDLAGADSLATVSDPAQAVGSVLTLPVAEGGLIAENLLGGTGGHLAEHQVEVSTMVQPGQVPSSVGFGSTVSVVITGDEPGDVSYPAQVTSMSTTEAGGTQLDLAVDASHALIVARAAVDGQIALVHTPGDGS